MWVKLLTDETNEASVEWGGKRGPYPKNYRISKKALFIAGDRLKRWLKHLKEWQLNPAAVDLAKILRELALAGKRVRTVLFDALPERSGAPTDISNLQRWFEESQRTDRTLFVNTSPQIHVPWSMVFEGDPSTLRPGATNPAEYADFWCMKFDLSTMFFAHTDHPNRLTRSANAFYLISALHRRVYAKALERLRTVDRNLADEIEVLLDTPLGKAFTVDACKQHIDNASTKDAIFHFFGHGADGILDMGDNERIDPGDFKELMDRLIKRGDLEANDSCNLVILNACESMFGDEDYALRTGAARPRICGFIASEAEVPADFALRFSFRFLSSLVRKEQSVAETMRNLRSDATMWPLVLLYGCYAEPDFRFKAAPAVN